MNMKSKVTVFEYGDKYIYVPVSKPIYRKNIALAKPDDDLLRAFLPSSNLTEVYSHSFTDKSNKQYGVDYFETVIAIQKGWNDKLDGLSKFPRGVILEGVLTPSFGFIKIKVEILKKCRLSRSDISTLLTFTKVISDGIYNINSEIDDFFDSTSTTYRKFQSKFDNKSKNYWGESCVVTGVSVPVQSCHIKSVENCKNTFDIKGLIDVANSIRLQVSLHWLFDKGYFSFLDDGSIIIAGKFSIYDMDIYKIHPKIKIDLPEGASKYLAEHRAEFFSHLTKCAA
jgi:hypothetical protein